MSASGIRSTGTGNIPSLLNSLQHPHALRHVRRALELLKSALDAKKKNTVFSWGLYFSLFNLSFPFWSPVLRSLGFVWHNAVPSPIKFMIFFYHSPRAQVHNPSLVFSSHSTMHNISGGSFILPPPLCITAHTLRVEITRSALGFSTIGA